MEWKRKDLDISHLRGSGPGGQNRNKRWTGVRVVHKPTGLTFVETRRRSQSQNLCIALERLQLRLSELGRRKRPRIATHRPPRSEKRREEEKARRSQIKNSRRRVPYDPE